jgi:GT2 family glycosyltransferase
VSVAPLPAVSVVLGTYNRRRYLRATIEALRAELEGLPAEIIVVDGGSTDGTIRWLTKQKDAIAIVQHNRGTWRGRALTRRPWGYFMNLGFRAATAARVCMISDDALLVPGAIRNGLEQLDAADADVGGVAFYWRNWPHQAEYVVGLTFGDNLFVNHGLYSKRALEAVGYLDQETFFFYHADGDLSLRMLQAGYRTIAADCSFVEHYAHANEDVRASNVERQKDDWAKYVARWGSLGQPTRDWIPRSYVDTAHTADRYWTGTSRLSPVRSLSRRLPTSFVDRRRR